MPFLDLSHHHTRAPDIHRAGSQLKISFCIWANILYSLKLVFIAWMLYDLFLVLLDNKYHKYQQHENYILQNSLKYVIQYQWKQLVEYKYALSDFQ